jgi:hypothetical protein
VSGLQIQTGREDYLRDSDRLIVLACGPVCVVTEVLHSGRTWEPGRSIGEILIWWFLEPVFDQEAEVITLIEHLAFDLWMHFAQAPNLAVLLGDQLLAHGGDLDVEIILRQVEIRAEELRRISLAVKFDRKLAGLVVPADFIEI